MKVRKITRLISFFVLGSALAIFSGSYYLYSSVNQAAENSQRPGEKEFLDFLKRKKELPHKPGEALLVAAGQAVYSWDSAKNNFEKIPGAAADSETAKSKAGAPKKERADLDNDLIKEEYVLEAGRLVIAENAKIIWRSPADWWIDDFVLADANHDGVLDMNLSVWKAGNFGSSKPFWLKENDMSVKNHFFVFDLVDGAVQPIWQSSNLSAPNREFFFADIRGDGKNDLIVIEGDYSGVPGRRENYLAVWRWNGWGFTNEWRSEKGNFFNLRVEKNNEKNYIIVDFF